MLSKALILRCNDNLAFFAIARIDPDQDPADWFSAWIGERLDALGLLGVYRVELRDKEHVYGVCDITEEEDYGTAH